MNNLQYKHNLVVDWIKEADKKANIILALELFILGFIVKDFNVETNSFCNIYNFLPILLGLIALYFVGKTIFANIDGSKNKSENSLIFFGSIAKNNKKIKELLLNESNLDFKDDIANQIIINSKIASRKFKDINKGIIFIALQVIFIIIMKIF